MCDAFRCFLASEVEEFRLDVAAVDDGVELSRDVGILGGYIVVLVDVVAKVIEFEDGLVGAHLEAHALPLSTAHGLLAVLLVELPIETLVALLAFLSQECRHERNAIGLERLLVTCQFSKGGQHIPEGDDVVAVSHSRR